jgi:DNA-binding transcriptional ArsR family regulator
VKGVTRQTIAERLARLEGQGLIRSRRDGRKKKVRLAEWDHVTGEVTDPARLQAQRTAKGIRGEAPPRPLEGVIAGPAGADKEKDPTYTAELTRKAGYDADLRKIEIDKQMGRLLAVDDVRAAMERCAEQIVRDIDHIVARADDNAAAVARNGVAGAREFLKTLARELRETLARSMTLIQRENDESEDATQEGMVS